MVVCFMTMGSKDVISCISNTLFDHASAWFFLAHST